MPIRTAKFVSAVFAGLVASAVLATLSHSAAGAADDCLTAPKDRTPEGSHWYYRIDHVSKRHCWYLREEGERPAQAATPASPPAKPIGPQAETATQRSIADAHAELPPQTRLDPQYRDPGPNLALPASVAGNIPRAIVPDAKPQLANPQLSVVASRWPESSAAASAVSPAPTVSNFAANVQPATTPPPATAAIAVAAADASNQGRLGSVPLLLSVIFGALAFAGVIASVVFKFGKTRRARLRKVRARRQAIWQPTDDDRIVLSAHPGMNVLPRRAGFPRDLDQDRGERVADFFTQLSKRAPT